MIPRPTNPGRKLGSEERLCSLTYSMIGLWVELSPRTVGRYARRGDFNRKNLESTLQWVNARRARRGLPLIGAPEHLPTSPEPIAPTGGYNPTTGEYV